MQSATAEEFKVWNEEMASNHDPDTYHTSKSFLVRWIENTRVQELLTNLRVQPEHTVLEVGVGAGNILERIHAKRRIGLDLSNHLIQKARERLGDGVELIEGNAENLAEHIEPGSCDRLYCSEVLEHVQHPEHVLQGMASCLCKDGLAVITVPNESFIQLLKNILRYTGLAFLLRIPAENMHGDDWHLHHFDRKKIVELCSQFFAVRRVRAKPFFFLPIRFVVQMAPLPVS